MPFSLLIAESTADLAYVQSAYFINLGYEVMVALTEPECLGKLLQHRPDAMVLDYALPCSSVLKRLSAEPELQNIPVVLTSGFLSFPKLPATLNGSVVACLQKPFRLDELRRLLEAALPDKRPAQVRVPPSFITPGDSLRSSGAMLCLASAPAIRAVATLQVGRGGTLAERLQDALVRTGYPALRHVRIHVRNGRVQLQGSVPSYFLKQVAQQQALALVGHASDVQNDLQVLPTPPRHG